jgi:type I restriction enzyme R subunit
MDTSSPAAATTAPIQPSPAKAGSLPCVMTSINFEFLRAKRRELADLGGFAEQYAFTDLTSALVKLRTFAESLVKAVFAHHQLQMGYQSNLNDLLNDPSFKAITPAVVQEKLHLLRIKGNHAAHGTLHPLPPGKIIELVREAHDLGKWLHLSLDSGRLDMVSPWKTITLDTVDAAVSLKKENRAALQKLAEQEALMAKLLADLETARSQAEAAQKSEDEIKLILKQAQQAASVLDFSEEATRFKLIDEQLTAAGWNVGPRGKSTSQVGQEVEVLHQPTASGIGYADYVFWDENGKPLSVLETKKTAVDAERGKMQAKYYADGLEKMHGQRPIIFYSNGYEIFIWDDAKGEPPRPLFGFYSPDSLQYCLFQTKERVSQLASLNPKEAIIDRLYQIEGNKRVAETFDRRRRKGLIIQATGTGKTRVAIGLCELMIRARWAKRILFLCDRRELRKQALNAFSDHLPSEPTVIVNSRTAQDRNKRIYLATYPAMMKCFQNFDVGFFDLIIADESHRSIYNRYRDLFRYFDSYQVGLTATPVKFVFRNTYRLFDCETSDPTFNYTYEEAVTHDPPYLCPFKVIKHTTKFLRDGIKYKDLTKEQQEELDDQVDDPESIDFSREQVSRAVFNKDTDKQILRNLMENGIRNADGTRLGKTIIFARNHTHAKLLVTLFDEMYPQFGGDFCVRIDNYEPRAEQLIDDLKSNDGTKNITIAVSVDMLDTGIDIPEIVNLVFAKPVKSYSKFWQMIGRGTRLCFDLFGPGKDKQFFQVFDHWGNFEYFDELVKEEEPAKGKSLPEVLFEARIKLGETAISTQDLDALKLATKLLAADVASLPADCLSVREKWKEVKGVQKDGVLPGFQTATVAVLKKDIAPLMQWRDVRGSEAAHQFDLLVTRLQDSKLTKSAAAADIRDTIINQVSDLPINLTQVAEKLATIQKAKSTAYYETASVSDLEVLRTELRGIMRFKKKGTVTPIGPLILNLREDATEFQVNPHKPKLEGLDLAHYRSRVEGVLRALMEDSTALKKIRAGLPVAAGDLEELTTDVLLQDPDLHLDELLIHYPNKAQRIDLAIRQIIGLEAEKVDEKFRVFVQKYPALNANQIRFLELLKSYISRYGAIELEKLWEAPFTTIHGSGVDGVFTNSQQVDDLLSLLNDINQVAA